MGSRDAISEARRSQVPRSVPCPTPCESFPPEIANRPTMEATWSACRTRRREHRNDRTDVCWPRHQSHGADQPDSGGEEVVPRWRTPRECCGGARLFVRALVLIPSDFLLMPRLVWYRPRQCFSPDMI